MENLDYAINELIKTKELYKRNCEKSYYSDYYKHEKNEEIASFDAAIEILENYKQLNKLS